MTFIWGQTSVRKYSNLHTCMLCANVTSITYKAASDHLAGRHVHIYEYLHITTEFTSAPRSSCILNSVCTSKFTCTCSTCEVVYVSLMALNQEMCTVSKIYLLIHTCSCMQCILVVIFLWCLHIGQEMYFLGWHKLCSIFSNQLAKGAYAVVGVFHVNITQQVMKSGDCV